MLREVRGDGNGGLLMCYSDGESCDVWNEETFRARKEYRCDECFAPIPKGVKYIRIGSLYEGSWDTLRVHWECLVLWGAVRLDLCKGQGAIMIGGLDQELDEYGLREALTDEELTAKFEEEETPPAFQAEMRDAMMYRRRYDEIQEKYKAMVAA